MRECGFSALNDEKVQDVALVAIPKHRIGSCTTPSWLNSKHFPCKEEYMSASLIEGSYWRLKVGRFRHYVYHWTTKPLPPEMIPADAVESGMMIDVSLYDVKEVRRITKAEYLTYMYE